MGNQKYFTPDSFQEAAFIVHPQLSDRSEEKSRSHRRSTKEKIEEIGCKSCRL